LKSQKTPAEHLWTECTEDNLPSYVVLQVCSLWQLF